MIITIGALFLLDQNSFMQFDRTWPVILLVAGLFSFLSRSASTEGHVQPYMAMPMATAMPVAMQQPGMAQAGMAQAPAGMPAQPAINHSPTDQPGPTGSSNSNDDSQVNS